MCLLSPFHMLDTSLHNMSLTSDRLPEILQSILPVFDINSFEIWARNDSLWVLDCERCVRKPSNGFWKYDNLSSSAHFFLRRHLEELSPNTGFGKSETIQVVVSPLISLMFFAHSLHSNLMFPLDWNSNFILFQLLPTIVMFQKYLITFWFTDKMSFFCQ